jgi:anaerobic ribonucleoside-triphosphate reductase
VKKRMIPCEIYSRVVGYLRPVQNWNIAKRQEFEDRVSYKIEGTQAGTEESKQ